MFRNFLCHCSLCLHILAAERRFPLLCAFVGVQCSQPPSPGFPAGGAAGFFSPHRSRAADRAAAVGFRVLRPDCGVAAPPGSWALPLGDRLGRPALLAHLPRFSLPPTRLVSPRQQPVPPLGWSPTPSPLSAPCLPLPALCPAQSRPSRCSRSSRPDRVGPLDSAPGPPLPALGPRPAVRLRHFGACDPGAGRGMAGWRGIGASVCPSVRRKLPDSRSGMGRAVAWLLLSALWVGGECAGPDAGPGLGAPTGHGCRARSRTRFGPAETASPAETP